MNRVFEQIRFTVEITKDGSPTLRLPDMGEWMHHSSGAASETLYIYKTALDKALNVLDSSKTCVVGLGLAYIEISWAMALIEARQGSHPLAHQLTTFEIVPELKEYFTDWLISPEAKIYDDICSAFKISSTEPIKKILAANYKNEPIEGDFALYDQIKRWNIICYDAYSSKTTQKLWSEEFLNNFLQKHADEDCIFTTYACTGVLKKVLAANGFKVIRRPAFQGKGGHCTMAVRGRLTNIA